MKPIHVFSEIGKLKKVLLHRPGEEVENLTPDLLEHLLFDDIPYLKIAQEEHDAFAKILQDNGVEVVYIEKLTAETLEQSDDIKNNFIDEFLFESKIHSENMKKSLKEYLLSMDTQAMVNKMIAGIRKTELDGYKRTTLVDVVNDFYPFITEPMPNILFTRDTFASIGNGVSFNHMYTNVRQRETLFCDYVFKYHPDFKDGNVPHWYDRDEDTYIEGGDELVLNKETLAIGISERTESASIEKLARKLFAHPENTFKTILAFDLPHQRSFMHLDTVFTQIDYDKFTIHAGIEGPLRIFKITSDPTIEYGLKISVETKDVQTVLSETLGRPIELIRCGNGDIIDGGREQWNDGANTLAIAPNEIIVYSRNHVTNELLANKGVKLHIMPSSELSRGRGGPRCMSMPLVREDLE